VAVEHTNAGDGQVWSGAGPRLARLGKHRLGNKYETYKNKVGQARRCLESSLLVVLVQLDVGSAWCFVGRQAACQSAKGLRVARMPGDQQIQIAAGEKRAPVAPRGPCGKGV
jgi:hypothetical protein